MSIGNGSWRGAGKEGHVGGEGGLVVKEPELEALKREGF